MKKLILLLTLSLTTIIRLKAVDIQWQIELPAGTQVGYSASGSDGSAIAIDTTNDVLYWIGPDGNMIEVIQDFNGDTPFGVDGSVFVSMTQLILPIYDAGFASGDTKVVTKTESGYSTETLDGLPQAEAPLQSTVPFFLNVNSLQLTLYKIDSNTFPSLYGVTTVPANAIVIPASHQGDVTISLESSSDLVEWTPVLPGSYSPKDEARFFRVKAETEN